MKKFTTKLLMSIIAVAFAFVALGTSTYAWFSMNTTVKVEGMEIGAKSNNTYLLIGTGDNDTYTEIQTGKLTSVSVAVDNENTKVLPAKPIAASEIGTVNFPSGVYFATGSATAVTNAATAAAPANWYTAISHDPAAAINWSSTSPSDDVKQLNATGVTFSDYVIHKVVYLTLAEGSDDATNLSVTATIAIKETNPAQTADDLSAVKVLVATTNNYAILHNNNLAQNSNVGSLNGTPITLTDDSVVQVDIYIYYDGSEAAVNTNNVADLADATIELAFNVELAPRA